MRRGLIASCAAAALMGTFALIPLQGEDAAAKTVSAASATPVPSGRPNILFVLIDDMGYGDLSLTGNTAVKTPNIDKLASEGLVMTQFYDAAPICSASRAGFMTGQFPARNRFVTYIASREHNAEASQADWLDPKVPTLPRALRDAGYSTGHFGKWHMGGGREIGDAPYPTAYGFDESYTSFEGLGPRALPSNLPNNLARASAKLGHGPIDWVLRQDVTARYVDKTLDFVSRHHSGPWYAELWLDDVHSPWIPGEDQTSATAPAGSSPAEKRFFSVLVAADQQIGRLVDTLKRTGQLDNTLIVLTSDNGPTAGPRSPGSAGPYRGRKGSLYEGGIRQPLIVRWPGHVPVGAKDSATVGQGVDFYPTLAEIAGAAPPTLSDGISLFPAWRGTPIATRPDLYAFISRPGASDQAGPPVSIRSGPWKLLTNIDGSGAQLYNIVQDPRETHDMISEQTDVKKLLSSKLMAWVKTTGIVPNKAATIDKGVTEPD